MSQITAIDPEGDMLTMYLEGIGKDIFDIVDENGVTSATGPSLLTRSLVLKKPLDREVCASSG